MHWVVVGVWIIWHCCYSISTHTHEIADKGEITLHTCTYVHMYIALKYAGGLASKNGSFCIWGYVVLVIGDSWKASKKRQSSVKSSGRDGHVVAAVGVVF